MPVIPSTPARSRKNRVALAVVYVVATIWLMLMLFPMYYSIVMATADRAAVYEVPPRLDFRLAKVAVISLDLTSFAEEHRDLSRAELERAIKGEVAVAATRPLYVERELTASRVIASVNGQVIAEVETPVWRLDKYYNKWLNLGADRPRVEGEEFFEAFNVSFYPEALEWGATRPAPEFVQPEPGTLGGRVYAGLQEEGEVQGHWTLIVKPSLSRTFDNFRAAIGPYEIWADFSQGSVPRWFFNSAIYAAGVIISQLIVSALAGYALSRLWSRSAAYVLELFFLATLMLPAFLLFLPLFLMMRNFPFSAIPFIAVELSGVNLVNTFWGLILPHTAWAFSIMLFRGFFDQIPDELFQAARIDGSSEWSIFWRIVFPLSGPIFATMAIFTFTAVWGEFVWPYLVVSGDQRMWTLSIGLFRSIGSDVQRSMAIALISAIPTLSIFVFFQRYLVRGIVMTGTKG